MSSEWRPTSLADVSEAVDYGFTASADAEADGPRFLRITDIVGEAVDWSSVPRCAISEGNVARYGLTHGDIVIARTGASSGTSHWFRHVEQAVFASYLVRFRIDPARADSRFLSYVLRSPAWWDYVTNSLGGSAQPQLNARVMGEFSFQQPPVDEQRRIAGVLGALDDKIEHNRAVAIRLTETASVEFGHRSRSWSDAGREGVLAELGGPIVDRASDSQLPYIGLDAMPRGAPVLSEWTTEGAPDGQSSRFARGDILFGKLRPYFKKVGVAPIDGRCSTEILVLRPTEARNWGPLLGHVLSDDFIAHCIANSTGTKMPRSEWRNVENFPVVVPCIEDAERCTKSMHSIFGLVIALTHESRRLTEIRDALLPKLVFGKLRVPESYVPA